MSEIKEIDEMKMPESGKEEEKKEKKEVMKKQIIFGILPANNKYFLDLGWFFCRDEIANLAKEVGDNYTAIDIYREVYTGSSFLYLSFVLYDEEEVTPEKYQEKLLEVLSQKDKATFLGYFVARLEESNIHIWQAFIKPAYRGTNAFAKGSEYIEKQAKEMGSPSMTFSSHLPQWKEMVEKIGFKHHLTLYKKIL